MLAGISPVIGPDLLAALCSMGHGDEIVIADAHFPGYTFNDRTLRSDGVMIADLLDGILPLFPLDRHVESPVCMMDAAGGDVLDPAVEQRYRRILDAYGCGDAVIHRIERFAFYERTRKAFAVVLSGDTATYGNILLKKGVVDV